MKSVLFVSTATEFLDGTEFRALVTNAAMNNCVKGLTGVLGYNGMNFIQLVEGPEKGVDECMDRIKVDKRHSGVIPIREKTIEKRECDEWGIASCSMYYNPLRPETLDTGWAHAGLEEDTRKILSRFARMAF